MSTTATAAGVCLMKRRNNPSLLARASSERFCSVMLRAIFEAPVTFPFPSFSGEMVAEIMILRPSLQMRSELKCSTVSPREIRARISDSSCCLSGGKIISKG